ncbi:hypothetical protein APSETT445_008604 [Aspergillus pseudonomiae]
MHNVWCSGPYREVRMLVYLECQDQGLPRLIYLHTKSLMHGDESSAMEKWQKEKAQPHVSFNKQDYTLLLKVALLEKGLPEVTIVNTDATDIGLIVFSRMKLHPAIMDTEAEMMFDDIAKTYEATFAHDPSLCQVIDQTLDLLEPKSRVLDVY